ncbi:MAG: PD-(D/E)XK nuclease family transposase, partial [Chlorobium sp.]
YTRKSVKKVDYYTCSWKVKLLDRSTGQVFYNKLTFIYLELPKFRKSVDELVTDFDKWCYLLRHLPELTDRPQRLQEKVFSKVFEIAEIAKYSPAEAAAYEDSLKIYRDLKNVIDTAYDEGKAEGKLEVALRLVASGMSAEQASKLAGVPVALLQSS